MRTEVEELLKSALAFPPEARAALANSLLESLDSECDPDAEELWREETPRLLKQIDRGEVAMVGWEDARRELWAPRKLVQRLP